MRANLVGSSFYFKISIMIYHYMICNILCANLSESGTNELYLETHSKDDTKKKIEDMDKNKNLESTDITMMYFGQEEEVTTSEDTYLPINTSKKSNSSFDKKEICSLINSQKVMMAKMMGLFGKLKKLQTTQNPFQISKLESLYEEFSDLTSAICKKMIFYIKKEFATFDKNITMILENINNILVVKSVLIDDIKLKGSNLFLVIPLRESLKNTVKFYFEVEREYSLQEKKRNKTNDMFLTFKRALNMAMIYMKNISIRFQIDDLNLTKARVLKVLKIFDENRKGSFFSVHLLIKKKMSCAQRKLSSLNEAIYNFMNPYN